MNGLHLGKLEKIKILGAVLDLPANLHSQSGLNVVECGLAVQINSLIQFKKAPVILVSVSVQFLIQ